MIRRLLPIVLALVASCGPATGPSPPGRSAPRSATAPRAVSLPDGVDYEYVVRVDEGLRRLDATVCSRRPLWRLVASRSSAPDHLLRAETRGDGPRRELVPDGRDVVVRDGPAPCLGYVVDLRGAAQRSRWGGLSNGDVVTLSSTEWLWRPAPRPDGATGTVRFELPEGVRAAVPWPEDGTGHRIGESAFRFLAHTAFGRFEPRAIEATGGTVRMVRLPGPLEVSDEELVEYVDTAARSASSIYGRFPVELAQVIVAPVGPGSDPVAFGHVGRGGGASVVLLVRRDAGLAELERDWVAPHELSHLAMPYVQRADAWLSEGVATYYQEIVRARIGVYDAERAWRGVEDGFERGRRDGTGRSLREESENMFRTHAFRRVYWGGAAFALALDVELRRRGLGSLDALMEGFDGCCDGWQGAWTAQRVLARWDDIIGEPVASEVAERHLRLEAMPDTEALYAYLGIVPDADGGLELDDSAPGADVRRAITAPR